jgi:hypothetical protein
VAGHGYAGALQGQAAVLNPVVAVVPTSLWSMCMVFRAALWRVYSWLVQPSHSGTGGSHGAVEPLLAALVCRRSVNATMYISSVMWHAIILCV